MTPQKFIAKWTAANLSERSSYQSHFNDLCALLGQPTPTDADPDGSWFTFEKHVGTAGGGAGFADVWRKGCFGWEYKRKGKHKSLMEAYQQLLRYREALGNPPLLVVCDLARFEVHTNFTDTDKKVYAFALADLADPKNLTLLRAAFTAPGGLRPGLTRNDVTEDVAARLGRIADGMRGRGIPPARAAHFLVKLVFCMFAEDVELLPRDLFKETVAAAGGDPGDLSAMLADLFAAMAKGGRFGHHKIKRFNGGLFRDVDVIPLTGPAVGELVAAAACDWSRVEPAIFGTLFERGLDPEKRSQVGAHYTHPDDIRQLLEPVMLAPLRREWDAVREKADGLWERVQAGARTASLAGKVAFGPGGRRKKASAAREAFDDCVLGFLDRLSRVTVLDPACGSGNFLYLALKLLLDLEYEVLAYAAERDLARFPTVRPTQLRGLEVNPYARELAQVAIWIGYLQWKQDNAVFEYDVPILDPMDSVRQADAVLDVSDPAAPTEPDWPDADFIVGNPPFLGNKLMRSRLGAAYVGALWGVYGDRLPAASDLCCYWLEKARAMVAAGRARRAGMLATTAVKQAGGRRALERICDTARLFFGVSDREWALDGAAVRIVMAGFEPAAGTSPPVLDGRPVARINPDLTSGADAAAAKALAGNAKRCFMGTTKVGAFDIPFAEAVRMLGDPNPHGRPNSDVLRPWANGSDIVRRPSNRWVIDFGVTTGEAEAALYAAPFDHVRAEVRGERQGNGREAYRVRWWIHGEPRPAFRAAVRDLGRYVGTARVAKHRVFVWLDAVVLPDSKVIAFAFDDDYHFGVLHSRAHEVWTLAQCGWHGQGNDPTYNPNTCLLTFPFPEPYTALRHEIAAAAKDLDTLRRNWLRPPAWTRTDVLSFPGSAGGPWHRYVRDADPDTGIGTVRYPLQVPKDADAAGRLKERTLTALYNRLAAGQENWLTKAHKKLDELVFAAYGWPPDLGDDELIARLLDLNLSRAGSAGTAVAAAAAAPDHLPGMEPAAAVPARTPRPNRRSRPGRA